MTEENYKTEEGYKTDEYGNRVPAGEVPYEQQSTAVATEPVVGTDINPSAVPAGAATTPGAADPERAGPFTPASAPGQARYGEIERVEEVPAQQAKYKGSPEAGLQRINAARSLLSTHSAARVGGGIISEVLQLLDEAYSVLSEHHKPKDQKDQDEE